MFSRLVLALSRSVLLLALSNGDIVKVTLAEEHKDSDPALDPSLVAPEGLELGDKRECLLRHPEGGKVQWSAWTLSPHRGEHS